MNELYSLSLRKSSEIFVNTDSAAFAESPLHPARTLSRRISPEQTGDTRFRGTASLPFA